MHEVPVGKSREIHGRLGLSGSLRLLRASDASQPAGGISEIVERTGVAAKPSNQQRQAHDAESHPPEQNRRAGHEMRSIVSVERRGQDDQRQRHPGAVESPPPPPSNPAGCISKQA